MIVWPDFVGAECRGPGQLLNIDKHNAQCRPRQPAVPLLKNISKQQTYQPEAFLPAYLGSIRQSQFEHYSQQEDRHLFNCNYNFDVVVLYFIIECE